MSIFLGESREDLLRRVRGALGHPATIPPTETPPAVHDPTARLVAATDDLAELFIRNAAVVGMRVQHVTEQDVLSKVIDVLHNANARRVGVGMAGWETPLRAAGFDVADWTSQPIDAQFDLDAGVTGVEAAIVESGSLVCTSGGGRGRGLSLIPPVHIAIVRPADLIPDMLDLWPRLRNPDGTLPSSAAIITGPSKTADIEGILVTGVHGPEVVHVLVVT